jgi:peptidoglycan/LPS O-acetylase OafA/YrhL
VSSVITRSTRSGTAADSGVGGGPRPWTYQPALDGLRAFAVGAVMLYHFEPDWLPGGFLGVDTFFVLSGFLITSLLLDEHARTGGIALGAFWARRARRLLPALMLLLVAVFIAVALWSDPLELSQLRGDGLAGLFYVFNWRLIATGQSYFELFSDASPLRHLWSLAIEEQFYLLWPLIVLVCLRRSPRRLAIVCVAGIAGSAMAMAVLFEPGDPSRAYFGTDTRAQSLLVGALLAVATRARYPIGRVWAYAGALAFAACALWWVTGDDHAAWLYRGGTVVYALLTATVIAAALLPSAVRRGLSLPALVAIGKISYGLYLWHWPVLVFTTPRRVGGWLGVERVDGLALTLVRIALTAALAAVSYHLVEMPIRRGTLRGGRGWIAGPAAAVGCSVVIIAATAGAKPLPAYLDTSALPTVPVAPVATMAPLTSTVGTLPPIEPSASAAAPTTVGEPAPAPTAAATAAPTAAPTPPPPTTAPGRPPSRLLLVGDSVAASLEAGLADAVAARGATFDSIAFPGCGVVTGIPLSDEGERIEWGEQCSESLPSSQVNAVAAQAPDLVVWLSTWELAAREVDGQAFAFGTPEGDAVLLALMQQAADRLTGGGADLAVLTIPPSVDADIRDADAGFNAQANHFNGLLRELAGLAPDRIHVVDFATLVCAGTPEDCPADVEGLRPRPRDGAHFEPDGARWAGAVLADQLLALRI